MTDLRVKTPKEAAKIVGIVERDNYLAHSIRKIEFIIFKKYKKHYRIATHAKECVTAAKIYFHDNCCVILLPYSIEKNGDPYARLILAHELGHLVYNINKLNELDTINQRNITDDEEIYAWKFAFSLVKIKSQEHKANLKLNKFIYTDLELKNRLLAIVKEKTSKKDELSQIYKDIEQWLETVVVLTAP